MKILITGASGLIGKALQRSLAAKGHEMLLASRHDDLKSNEVRWMVDDGFDNASMALLEGIDAVVHLAGESISAIRWTDKKKNAIRDSRVHGTRSIVDAMTKLKKKPRVLVSASATGFYGDRGDEIVSETDGPGDTFLAATTSEWEGEASRAEDAGIRTVLVRTGIVLSKDGGALAAMLTPFRLGIGGVIGSGKQWMSWISLDDIVAVYELAVENEHVRGPVNAVSPNPVSNAEFTKTLGKVLHRPTLLPFPEFAVKLIFGEMGDALLLDSARVAPQRLEALGFRFRYPHLEAALEHAVR